MPIHDFAGPMLKGNKFSEKKYKTYSISTLNTIYLSQLFKGTRTRKKCVK
jgi:hypothetical protein